MDYNYFSRSLITDEQLKRISYLTFSREAKEIVALLSEQTKKFKQKLKIAFILDAISTLYLFLILALIPVLTGLSHYFLSIIAIIYLLFQFFIIYIRTQKLNHLKNYQQVVGDLGENLLSVIFNDHPFSLSGRIPDNREIKAVMKGLSASAESLNNYLNFVKEILGVIFGLTAVIMIAFSTQDFLYVNITYEVFIILTLFAIYTVLEGFYDLYEKDYRRKNNQYDDAFLTSEALLSRTTLGFDKEDYLNTVKPLNSLSNNINLVGLINRNLLPIFFLFLPLLFGNVGQGLILLIVGLFISSRLFSLSNPIINLRTVESGFLKVQKLDNYLQMVLEDGSEITPNIYKNIRKDYLDKHQYEKVGDRLVWGDLIIEGLNYEIGWEKSGQRIFIDRLILPYGRVSFLIGKDGLGKTLFGRTITLRYANFQAEKLALGEKDLRTFSSIDQALKYLHISSLRSISTSYRQAMGMYLKQGDSTNLFIKKVFSEERFFDISTNEIAKHFNENKDYYKAVSDHAGYILGDVFRDNQPLIDKNERKESYYHLVSTIYKHFYEPNLLKTILEQLKARLGEEIVNKAFYYAAKAEFISYYHLKNYVPEVSLFYMDADLSKPPVSTNMTLKFLFALDVYMEGLVFVVDEPFKQLETDSAKKILEDLMSYAKSYNAVVVILDEKIHPEMLEEYKGQDVLGKVLRFEDDGFSTTIKGNELEIS